MTADPSDGQLSARANTVLVFGAEQESTAAISSVIARACDQNHEEGTHFTGPATFSEKTAKHILEVVVPTADSIFSALNLPKQHFVISVANLDVASLNDLGLTISGFSADVPVLLALLSARLEIPVPESIVSTGHIASFDGDIRSVRGIPAKVAAALESDSIHAFVYPAVDTDGSLEQLSPGEKQRITDAVAKAKGDIKMIAIRDISELVRSVFPEDQVVLSSLKNGFFNHSDFSFTEQTILGRAIGFFTKNNAQRFWDVLERQLLAGCCDFARKLLQSLVRFHLQQKIYPQGMGNKLLQLIHSLPPETRRYKLDFPLLPIPECIQLSQFAGESDHEDVLRLFKAAHGEKVPEAMADVARSGMPGEDATEQTSNKLQAVLSEIERDNLTKVIGLPIDSARAAYVMDSVVAESHEEFSDTIASFYLHLLRHTRKVSEPIDKDSAGAEASALLETAYSKKGGLPAAFAEARAATNGGLRLIIDVITEQFKQEQQEKHVNHVLKTAFDPLDWDSKVVLMKDILKRLEPHLPPEIISEPPEKFASHYEMIVRAYVQSMDQVKTLFRSF